MDGLRKVPDNVPNREMLAQYLGKPLTRIPDPFGTHDSFGAHNNAHLRVVPGQLRLRLRVRLLDRLLRRRPLRRRAAARPGTLRRGDGRSSCPRSAPTAAPPIRRSCRSIRAPASSCRCRWRRCDPAAGTVVWRDPDSGEAFETSVKGGRVQAAMEGRLGDALVRARRRLRDVGQGPDRQRPPVQPHLPHPRRAAAGGASPTNCSSTSTARRSASRRATACRSRNGCATPRRNPSASSCTTRRSAPSGCIST